MLCKNGRQAKIYICLASSTLYHYALNQKYLQTYYLKGRWCFIGCIKKCTKADINPGANLKSEFLCRVIALHWKTFRFDVTSHVMSFHQSDWMLQVTWWVSTNQIGFYKSRDELPPIRWMLQVTWWVSTNQIGCYKSCDEFPPIRLDVTNHVMSFHQSNWMLQVTWRVSTFQSALFHRRAVTVIIFLLLR